MALTDNEIGSIMQDFVLPGWKDQVFRKNIVTWWILGGKRPMSDPKYGTIKNAVSTIGKALYFSQPIEYGKANQFSYGANTIIPTAATDVFNHFRVPVRGLGVSQTITILDQLTVNTRAAKIDLVAGKLKNLWKSFEDKLATYILSITTQSDGSAPHGMGDLFGASTFQGLAASDFTDSNIWPANLDAGADAADWDMMQALRRTAKRGDGPDDRPNLYLMADTIYDKLEAILMPQQIYPVSGPQGRDDVAKAGFDGMMFGRAVVFSSDYYEKNSMTAYVDALNLETIGFKFADGFDMVYGGGDNVWEHDLKTPHQRTASLLALGNFFCGNRGANARKSNVS